jgi:hypothetical protein
VTPREREREHDHRHERPIDAFAGHLAADLLLMGRFIVLGAALAAVMQTIVRQRVFTGALTTPLPGALIKIVLSLCSEAGDALRRHLRTWLRPAPRGRDGADRGGGLAALRGDRVTDWRRVARALAIAAWGRSSSSCGGRAGRRPTWDRRRRG